MISFYPGPSQIEEKIPKYVIDAYKNGIASINHRSPEFQTLYDNVIKILQKRLNLPEDYHLIFTSSATECWEILAQSLIEKDRHHIYNGAFGEKWYRYTRKLTNNATFTQFNEQEPFDPIKVEIPANTKLICLTQNETSNGTQIPNTEIKQIRDMNPESMIAVDATSSLGGIYLNFRNADIWFASVQKCLGLPAGMAVLICSPLAIQRAKSLGDNKFYNSLSFLIENMEKRQTSYTPNVLSIYLLYRVLKERRHIKDEERILKKRNVAWVNLIDRLDPLDLLIKSPEARSTTVLTVKCSVDDLEEVKQEAKQKGILLGEGYGIYKGESFRIANFPAIKDRHITKLKEFLISYFQK